MATSAAAIETDELRLLITAYADLIVVEPIRLHEDEDFGGSASLSRANQAAAFFRMSRSISSSRTRFRNRVFSADSALVKDRLAREIELPSHLGYPAAGSDQFQDLLPELRRMG